jgi:hypothetical protein
MYRVSRGQQLGDLALFAILAPVALAFFAFLSILFGLAIAALLGLRQMPEPLVAGFMGGGLFMALLVNVSKPQWWWSVALESDALVLQGPLWQKRLPYEDVRFLRAGGEHRWRSGPQQAAGSIPLVIESAEATTRIYLQPDAAEHCLKQLRGRCPNAAAVDAAGRSHLPARASEVSAAGARLARFWRRAGRLAVAMGLFILFPSVTLLFGSLWNRVFNTTSWQLLAGIPAGVSLVFFGRGMLRKARRFARLQV